MSVTDLDTARYVLGGLDLAAGLTMLWTMQRITGKWWGISTAEGRWSLFRRAVYGLMSFALFGLGVQRLVGGYETSATGAEVVYQCALIIGVMVFPVMRAFGLTSQDMFLGLNNGNGRKPANNDEKYIRGR